MSKFDTMEEKELLQVDGGAGLEIMIGTKVLTGAAAFGVVGVAAVALVGVAALGFYVASQN